MVRSGEFTRVAALGLTVAGLIGQNVLPKMIDVAEAAPVDTPAAKDPAVAHASSSKWCPGDVNITVACHWVVDRVVDVPGENDHQRHFCVGAPPEKAPQDLTCEIGKSKSSTASASIGGSHPVGAGELTASVGYDVTEESSVSGSKTIHLKKNQGGELFWKARFGFLKDVFQKYVRCVTPPKGGGMHCSDTNRPDKVAHTEKYLGPIIDARKYRNPNTN